jgi:hypothetical protein
MLIKVTEIPKERPKEAKALLRLKKEKTSL